MTVTVVPVQDQPGKSFVKVDKEARIRLQRASYGLALLALCWVVKPTADAEKIKEDIERYCAR